MLTCVRVPALRPLAAAACSLLLGVSALAFSGAPASAGPTYYKFYAGTTGYGGPYNGSNTVYGKIAAAGTPTLMPSNGTAYSGDILGTPLNFTGVIATAPNLPTGAPNMVWDDLTPIFGGLGTGLLRADSDTDQISGSESLTLSFASQVKLDGVATLFDSPHLDFGGNFLTESSVMGASSTIKFLMSVDGGTFKEYNFLDANDFFSTGIYGTSFTFMQDTSSNPEFYVSALAVEAVPAPATLALFASGLGGLALLRWLKSKKAAVPAA